jgi:hypothetical protein
MSHAVDGVELHSLREWLLLERQFGWLAGLRVARCLLREWLLLERQFGWLAELHGVWRWWRDQLMQIGFDTMPIYNLRLSQRLRHADSDSVFALFLTVEAARSLGDEAEGTEKIVKMMSRSSRNYFFKLVNKPNQM